MKGMGLELMKILRNMPSFDVVEFEAKISVVLVLSKNTLFFKLELGL